MTGPNFDELGTDGENSSSSNSKETERNEFSQIHVKGKFGTVLFRNDKGCCVCGRNASILMLLGFKEVPQGQTWDDERIVCEHHEGDVRGDLEYTPDEIVVRGF